jgi:hypothetical protein
MRTNAIRVPSGDQAGESEERRRPFRVSLRSCVPFERTVYKSTPSGEEAPYAIVKAIRFPSGSPVGLERRERHEPS